MNSAILDINTNKDFILAGNAHVTFKSVKTKNHFTYRIRKKKTDDIWFVSVLYNPSNKNYNYIGCILSDGKFVHTKGSQVKKDCISFKAFEWTWNNLQNKQVEIWHEGKCGRCGRPLTDPESIKRGYGPNCWIKIGG